MVKRLLNLMGIACIGLIVRKTYTTMESCPNWQFENNNIGLPECFLCTKIPLDSGE